MNVKQSRVSARKLNNAYDWCPSIRPVGVLFQCALPSARMLTDTINQVAQLTMQQSLTGCIVTKYLHLNQFYLQISIVRKGKGKIPVSLWCFHTEQEHSTGDDNDDGDSKLLF